MNKELIINNDPKSPVSEAFRVLRTNMQYLKNSSSKQTIVTTSTVQFGCCFCTTRKKDPIN